MTHGIFEDGGPKVYYSYTETKKKKLTEEEYLLEELKKHLKHVSQYSDEKHTHKKNVLEIAIDFLTGKKTFDQLETAIKDNHAYNKAIFPSDTEKYVHKAISLAPVNKAEGDKPKLSADAMKLIVQLQTQMNAVSGKDDQKHKDKTAVLQAAIDLLHGKSDKETLEKVIKEHPRYNEAFFTSKTEQLVKRVIELAAPKPETDLHP